MLLNCSYYLEDVNDYFIWKVMRKRYWINCCTKSDFVANLNKSSTSKIKATCFLWIISLQGTSEVQLTLASGINSRKNSVVNLWFMSAYSPIHEKSSLSISVDARIHLKRDSQQRCKIFQIKNMKVKGVMQLCYTAHPDSTISREFRRLTWEVL